METELGRGKRSRRTYGFDEVALAPSIITVNPDDIDISTTIAGLKLKLPIIASAMDGVVSPKTAIVMSKCGGLGVLNLGGVWAKYENADEILEQIASVSKDEYVELMQKIYLEPSNPKLVEKRIKEIKDEKKAVVGTAYVLKEFLQIKFKINRELTYRELLEEIKGKDINKEIKDQLLDFFKRISINLYSGIKDHENFSKAYNLAEKTINELSRR
jgi:IMP dehydrogenase